MLNCFPDYFQIHLKVAVRDGISHLISNRKWSLWVRGGKYWILGLYAVTRLTDDFDIPNHSILRDAAIQKILLINTHGVALDTRNGIQYVG